MMLGVSVVMYTGNYVSRSCKYIVAYGSFFKGLIWILSRHLDFNVSVDPLVQEKREQKRVAMKEYYEKHGGGDHH